MARLSSIRERAPTSRAVEGPSVLTSVCRGVRAGLRGCERWRLSIVLLQRRRKFVQLQFKSSTSSKTTVQLNYQPTNSPTIKTTTQEKQTYTLAIHFEELMYSLRKYDKTQTRSGSLIMNGWHPSPCVKIKRDIPHQGKTVSDCPKSHSVWFGAWNCVTIHKEYRKHCVLNGVIQIVYTVFWLTWQTLLVSCLSFRFVSWQQWNERGLIQIRVYLFYYVPNVWVRQFCKELWRWTKSGKSLHNKTVVLYVLFSLFKWISIFTGTFT